MSDDDKFRQSPYTEIDSRLFKNNLSNNEGSISKKKGGQIQILKKKAASSNVIVANSRDSKLPTSATSNHTSSIPSLPPVVRDSWFKDKVAMQNLNDLKKRLQQRGNNYIEVYQDSDTNDNKEMATRSSAESSYFIRGTYKFN